MKYLCLGYLDMKQFDELPELEKREILEACYAQCRSFRETGRILAEEGLQHTSQAKSIRPRSGQPVVTDGPFTEAKEQIGSFFLIEAESIEEAVQIASLHPAAKMGEAYGFGIEVRPIQ